MRGSRVVSEASLGEGSQALWISYRCSRDAGLRHRLIEHYIPLARKVALRAYRHAIQPCSFDDYLQYALVGLIEAVDLYDPTRSVPFEVYSKHRIRGAILSAIGHESEAAAHREFVRRAMPERLASLCSDSGDSLHELMSLTLGVALGVLLEREALELPDDAPHANPYAVAELGQLVQRIRGWVDHLPDREREVIVGHYFECMEFRVLAEELELSKGRISQLHGQGIRRLQQMLVEQPRINRKL